MSIKREIHPNAVRTAKLASAIAKLNNAMADADKLKNLFLYDLKALPDSVEKSTMMLIAVKEFQLLEMNEKALQNLVNARKTILDRLVLQSQGITKLSKGEKL